MTLGIHNPAPNEYEAAVSIADRLLDLPGQDPDSDEMQVCRQFLRAVERQKEYEKVRRDHLMILFAIVTAWETHDAEGSMAGMKDAAAAIGHGEYHLP